MAKPEPGRIHQAVTGVFGAFLIGVAVLVIAVNDASARLPALLAALVLGGLGLDALISAIRGKRSLLSRIGPLP